MRRVRLSKLVALALLSGLVLAGCRSDPAVAFYIGDAKVTEAHVDAVVTEAAEAREVRAGGEVDRRALRTRYIRSAILSEVLKREFADRKLPEPAVDYAGTANTFAMPANLEVVRVDAQTNAYLVALAQTLKPVQPTEDEAKYLFDYIVANRPDITPANYEELREVIRTDAELGLNLAIAREVEAISRKQNLTLNPKYQPLNYVLLAGPSPDKPPLLGIKLGEGAPVETLP